MEAEQQAPFLCVLGDILPQDGQAAGKDFGSGGNPEWASSSNASHGAGMPAGAVIGGSINAEPGGSINNVATGTPESLTSGNSSHAPAPSTTTGAGDQAAVQLDPSVDITKQSAPVEAQTGWQEDAGSPGQVAFTARITEPTAMPATESLSRSGAAIAAARFDTSNTGIHLTARDNTQPQQASASNAKQPADPAVNRALEQATQVGTEERLSANQSMQPPAGGSSFGSAQTAAGAGSPSATLSGTPSSQDQTFNPAVNSNAGQPSQAPTDNQLSPKPSAQTASAGQSADRLGSAQGASREIAPVVAVTAAAGARADGAGSQNGSPGMLAAQTLSSAPEDSRKAAAPRPEANDRTLQTPEAQNEPNEPASGSVRDIAIQLSNREQGTVQVRLSERAGELRVSVRTPDVGLSRGLRDGITELVGRLEHNGYRAETWQPSDGNGSGDQGHDSPPQGGSSHGQDAGGSQSGAGHQRNGRDQQQSDTPAPEWSGELQSSLKRSNNAWLPSATR